LIDNAADGFGARLRGGGNHRGRQHDAGGDKKTQNHWIRSIAGAASISILLEHRHPINPG
jgi:hypothetical protein